MASIEVMKERARIAGRFNLSARRNPEHRALVALAAQRAGGECHVIPAAPAEKVADVFRRSRNIARESAVLFWCVHGHIALRPLATLWRCENTNRHLSLAAHDYPAKYQLRVTADCANQGTTAGA